MDEDAFRFEGVTKRFEGHEALRDFTLAVPRGSVVGFVGRNGAGKTTAIRCLMGLARPNLGRVEVLGRDPWTLGVETKRRIGYMSEKPIPFPWSKVSDLIDSCSPLYPTWDTELEDRIRCHFSVSRARRLQTLSLGQQRALALLLALCPRPELLVLDEPAANLDAVVRREFLESVLGLVAEEGRTVFLASHILSDVERVADRLAVIHEGRLLLFRTLDDLKERVRRFRLVFDGVAPEIELPQALRVRRSGSEILATLDGADGETADRLAETTGARVEVQPIGLEEFFIDLVGDRSWAA